MTLIKRPVLERQRRLLDVELRVGIVEGVRRVVLQANGRRPLTDPLMPNGTRTSLVVDSGDGRPLAQRSSALAQRRPERAPSGGIDGDPVDFLEQRRPVGHQRANGGVPPFHQHEIILASDPVPIRLAVLGPPVLEDDAVPVTVARPPNPEGLRGFPALGRHVQSAGLPEVREMLVRTASSEKPSATNIQGTRPPSRIMYHCP